MSNEFPIRENFPVGLIIDQIRERENQIANQNVASNERVVMAASLAYSIGIFALFNFNPSNAFVYALASSYIIGSWNIIRSATKPSIQLIKSTALTVLSATASSYLLYNGSPFSFGYGILSGVLATEIQKKLS